MSASRRLENIGLLLFGASLVLILLPFSNSFHTYNLSSMRTFVLAVLFGAGTILYGKVARESFESWETYIVVCSFLVSLTVCLRYIPLPMGASCAFLIPIYLVWFWDLHLGLFVACFSIFVSSLLIGGIGPWLPYQAVGFQMVCYSAFLFNIEKYKSTKFKKLGLLICFTGFVSLIYGLIMNLWAWPSFAELASKTHLEKVYEYGVFYLASSLWWDLARMAGNFILILGTLTIGEFLFLRLQKRIYVFK